MSARFGIVASSNNFIMSAMSRGIVASDSSTVDGIKSFKKIKVFMANFFPPKNTHTVDNSHFKINYQLFNNFLYKNLFT